MRASGCRDYYKVKQRACERAACGLMACPIGNSTVCSSSLYNGGLDMMLACSEKNCLFKMNMKADNEQTKDLAIESGTTTMIPLR